MRFDEILRAHGFMRTERPPLMWEADTDDERFIPMLGEMIVVGLNAGNELAQLRLAVSNVTVEEEEEEDDPEETPWVEPGDYVAVTVKGRVAGATTCGVRARVRREACWSTSHRARTMQAPSTRPPATSTARAPSRCSCLAWPRRAEAVDPVHEVRQSFEVDLTVDAHADLLGDTRGGLVLGPDEGDQVVDVEVREGPVARRRGRLGRDPESLPSRPNVPADLHLADALDDLHRGPDGADDLAGLPVLDHPQAEALVAVSVEVPLDPELGLLPTVRRRVVLHVLGVGEHRGKRVGVLVHARPEPKPLRLEPEVLVHRVDTVPGTFSAGSTILALRPAASR